MLDYLVVGLGLAGISFCEQLEQSGKSFMVVNDDSQTSSVVAAGLYNPVMLKRFTLAWKAKEQLKEVTPFYNSLEQKLGTRLNHKVPVLRRLASISEQNDWFEAADKRGVGYFLSPKIVPNSNSAIEAPFGYGEVLHTGRIDTRKMLSAYGDYLLRSNKLYVETFSFEALNIYEDHVEYGKKKARRIIFAEGFGIRQNPYFKYLPLNGTKGELLIIESPDLNEKKVVKGPIFLIPLGNNQYLAGSTYERRDKSNVPTDRGKAQLQKKLDSLLKCNYKIIEHKAGVRPSVTDRRPLVGRHPQFKNLYVLNGFGSRGVMIAPYASRQLFEFIEFQYPIDADMNVDRFELI